MSIHVFCVYRHGYWRHGPSKYEDDTAQKVAEHMFSEFGVRARIERQPSQWQCPQCPYEENQKGKLTRHKVGCDKRFRPERNLEPPHDFEPPAKVPKPPATTNMYGNRSGH